MPKALKMILVLTVVGVFSGGVLSFVYQKMDPQIKSQREKALREAILKVLPGASRYEICEDIEEIIYCGFNGKGESVGYAIPASGNGYQGKIEIIFGISRDLKNIHGIEVIYNVETPGLGARIGEREFLQQFEGLYVKPSIEYVKNLKPSKPNQVQAITGATISTRALVNIINGKIASLPNHIP